MDLSLKLKLYDKFREKFNVEDSEDLVEIVAASLDAEKQIENDKLFSQRQAQIIKMEKQTNLLKALWSLYVLSYMFFYFSIKKQFNKMIL